MGGLRVNPRCRRSRFLEPLLGAGVLISRVGHREKRVEGTRMAGNEAMLIGAKTAASARCII